MSKGMRFICPYLPITKSIISSRLRFPYIYYKLLCRQRRIISRFTRDLFIGWWVCQSAPVERAVCADFVRMYAAVSNSIDRRGRSIQVYVESGYMH